MTPTSYEANRHRSPGQKANNDQESGGQIEPGLTAGVDGLELLNSVRTAVADWHNSSDFPMGIRFDHMTYMTQ